MPAKGVFRNTDFSSAVGCFARRIFVFVPNQTKEGILLQTKSKTRVLVECALMIALASVLSEIKFELPYGGSITAFSMVPILLCSYRNGTKWGLLTSFTYSLIQLFLGFKNVLYCKTLPTQFGCILLDYVLAFTVLGLAAAFSTPFGKKTAKGVAIGSTIVLVSRFLCSFISGVLLWWEYCPEGTPVWLYSAQYNGLYMLPELCLTVAGLLILRSRLIDTKE